MQFTAKHWNQVDTAFQINTYMSWDGKIMLGIWTRPGDEGISIPLLPEQLDELIDVLQDTRNGTLHPEPYPKGESV